MSVVGFFAGKALKLGCAIATPIALEAIDRIARNVQDQETSTAELPCYIDIKIKPSCSSFKSGHFAVLSVEGNTIWKGYGGGFGNKRAIRMCDPKGTDIASITYERERRTGRERYHCNISDERYPDYQFRTTRAGIVEQLQSMGTYRLDILPVGWIITLSPKDISILTRIHRVYEDDREVMTATTMMEPIDGEYTTCIRVRFSKLECKLLGALLAVSVCANIIDKE